MRRALISFLSIAVILLFSLSTFGMVEDVQVNTLSNGLTILTKEIHNAPVISMYVFYGVGSINEYGRITGIAHIVEHMMFKGSNNYGPNDIDKLIKSVGGSHNAYTTFDYTTYYINLPSNAIEIGLMIEADRMGNSKMAAEDFATERFVIMEERRMRTDNSPYGTFWERYGQIIFPRHPYRNPIIGYMPDIERITIDEVKEFYKKYYQPNNATVVLVGDFETKDILTKVKKYFGKIPKGPKIPKTHIPQEQLKGERIIKLKDVRNKYYLGYYSFRIPTYDSDDFPILQTIPLIMARSHTARLEKLVNDGLALATSSNAMGGRDPRTIMFLMYGKSEEDLMKCEEFLFQEIERLKNEPVSDIELEIAKNTLEADYAFSVQDASSIAEQIGYFHTIYELDYLKTIRDKYKNITKADIQRVAQKYLDKDYVIKGYLFPDTSGKLPSTQGSSVALDENSHGKFYDPNIGSKIDLRKYIPKELDYKIKLKDKIVRKELPNGAVILAMQNTNFDIVSIKGTLHSGPGFDVPGKTGLATLTVACLEYGTTSLNKEQIDLKKDLISLRGEIDTGMETVTFNYSMISSKYDEAMGLISDFIINPSFPENYFEQEKSNILMYHMQMAQDPEDVMEKTFNQLLYGAGHPYSRMKYGTIEDFQKLTVNDVKEFHKKNYGPEHLIIAVVGPQSLDELISVAEKYFAKWPKSGNLNEINFGDIEPLTAPREEHVSLPGRSQTYIRMGWPGIKIKDEDYYPLFMLNFILGGGSLSSRLGTEIRVKSGMAYSVYSYMHPRTFKGSLNVVLNTKAGNEEQVKAKILAVIKDVIEKGVTDEEFFVAQQFMINSQPRSLETNGDMVSSIEYMEYMNLGLDYYDTTIDRIKKVTKEDLQRVAKKYYDINNYVWVTVGP
ncbi:MAG: pitrilysin family protein [bacterium]|nr:pitrilysin family protein [bacterium]